MNYPTCGEAGSATKDSRPASGGEKWRRRRECSNGHRFTTVELVLEVHDGRAQGMVTRAELAAVLPADLSELRERLAALLPLIERITS